MCNVDDVMFWLLLVRILMRYASMLNHLKLFLFLSIDAAPWLYYKKTLFIRMNSHFQILLNKKPSLYVNGT